MKFEIKSINKFELELLSFNHPRLTLNSNQLLNLINNVIGPTIALIIFRYNKQHPRFISKSGEIRVACINAIESKNWSLVEKVSSASLHFYTGSLEILQNSQYHPYFLVSVCWNRCISEINNFLSSEEKITFINLINDELNKE
jgi:hypothetical protein